MARSTLTNNRLVARNFPYSLHFDGASDFVDFGDNLGKDRTNAFSISGWLKFANGNTGVWAGKRSGSSTGYELRLDGNNKILCTLKGSTGTFIQATSDVIEAAKFVFVVFTYDGLSLNTGMKIYVNANLLTMTYGMNTLDSSILSTSPLRFGARSDGSFSYEGFQTQNRIHNTELTQSEINDLYYNNIAVNVDGYWDYSDGLGTTLSAITGGINGTITNATWSTDTPFRKRFAVREQNNSIQFHGDSDDVSVPSSTTLNVGTGDFSMSFWMKAIKTGANNFVMGKLTSTAVPGWDIYIGATGRTVFKIYEGTSSSFATTDDSFDDSIWHHCVMTRSDNTVTAYIDGIFKKTNSAMPTGVNLDNTKNLYFGSRNGTSNDFTGELTDIRFYKGLAMTQTQIQDLYLSNVDPQTPTAHWDFSDGSGTTLTDVIAGENGTLNNGASLNPVWTTDRPFAARSAITSARTAVA